MPALEFLYLQDNVIATIPPCAYLGLPRLALLNLSFNQLKDAAEALQALRLLPRLRELYLNGNALQGQPRVSFCLCFTTNVGSY